jgi:ribosomal protein S18 acetylase RimI-like enzyme
MRLTYQPVGEDAFEDVLAMRLLAMQPSLQAAGRFDPQRARDRLSRSFDPLATRYIVVDGQRVGVEASQPEGPNDWRLAHLYVLPAHQRRGIGSKAVENVLLEAQIAQRHVVVEVLTGSPANAFYRRHGFIAYAESEWDTHYRYTVEMFE